MNEFLNTLELWLNTHQEWLAAAIFLTAFIESLAIAGVIVPGVAILFLLAMLTGHGATTLTTALTMAFAGAVAGDGLSFFVGHYLKDGIHQRWPFTRYPKMLESGEAFFARHGGKSIIIGRFIGPIRPIIPLVAGTLNYSPKRFFAYNVVSAVGWAPTYILPGYLVGASLDTNIQLPAHFYPILFAAITSLFVIFVLSTRLHWTLQHESPLYQSIANKMQHYSFTHRFWKLYSRHRPDIRGEFPLPSLIVALTSLCLFTILALVVSQTHWLAGIDQTTTLFFADLRHPLFDPAFTVITLLGDSKFLTITFITAIALLSIRGYYAAAIHIALAGLATLLLSHGLKDFFALSRPDGVGSTLKYYSFPSGHTSGATVMLTLLATYIAQEQTLKNRWKTYLACLIPAVFMGISRLYLGAHWLSDIVGGLLLGFFITAVTRVSFSRYDKEALTADSLTWIAGIGITVAGAVYVISHYDQAVSRYLTL